MAKKAKLTDRAAQAAREDIYDTVLPGFMVRVRDSGVKSFVLFTRMPGERNATRRTICRVGEKGLAEARDIARGWLAMIGKGDDPAQMLLAEKEEKARKRRDTIAIVAETYLATMVRGRRTAKAIEQRFRDILIPMFGSTPIAELKSKAVSEALRPIEALGTDRGLHKLGIRPQLLHPNRPAKRSLTQARTLFASLDTFLRWAVDTAEYGIEISPLMAVRKKSRFPGARTERKRVLADTEMAAVWRAASALPKPYGQLYRLLILTGLRIDEVREASWEEFDAKLSEWTIPKERMKGTEEKAEAHTVPITPQMRAILLELPRGNRGSFVFSITGGASPIARGGRHKDMLDDAVLADFGLPDSAWDDPKSPIKPFTNHDLRRTLRTNVSKHGMIGGNEEVGEAMLAHKKEGMQRVYNQNVYLAERRTAHELWGGFLIKISGQGKVVKMRRAA